MACKIPHFLQPYMQTDRAGTLLDAVVPRKVKTINRLSSVARNLWYSYLKSSILNKNGSQSRDEWVTQCQVLNRVCPVSLSFLLPVVLASHITWSCTRNKIWYVLSSLPRCINIQKQRISSHHRMHLWHHFLALWHDFPSHRMSILQCVWLCGTAKTSCDNWYHLLWLK